MREVPERRVGPWSPPDYEVDEQGKVVGAGPGEPNNWGRFGDEDQRGTANLMTAERIAQAAALVRTGRRFTLGLPVGQLDAPGHRDAPLHLFGRTTGDAVLGGSTLQISDDWVVMALQATTQIDGLAHFASDDTLYNGYWAGLVSANGGARRLGIHHLGDGLVGRAVLLDVARHTGSDPLDRDDPVGPDLLSATAEAQGVEVRAGDAVLVRTGWLGAWFAETVPRDGREPGVAHDALEWFAARDVALLAVDNTAVEPMPPPADHRALALHVGALRDLGLLLGELFDLDGLAADCADDGVYEGFLVCLPLPVVGAAGSPVNPLVIK